MTTLKLESPWPEVREKLKEIDHHLTDEDLVYEPGRDQELIDRLAIKLGRDKEAIREWIESVSFNRGKAS